MMFIYRLTSSLSSRRKFLIAFIVIFVSLGALGTALLRVHADPGTIIVNNPIDIIKHDDGLCSLSEAIANANASSDLTGDECAAGTGFNFINFNLPPGTTINVANTLHAATSIIIDGQINGNPGITLNGSGITSGGSIFSVDSSFGDLTLKNMVVSNGNATIGNHGGAINNNGGKLTITNVTFSNNHADTGGAIYNKTDFQTVISDSTFSGNTASLDAGALYAYGGQVSIRNTSFSNNTAINAGALDDSSNISITGGAFTNNQATSEDGGAIYSAGILAMTNVSLSGNSSGERGGAVFSGVTLTLTSVSMTGNTAVTGGGIAVFDGTATITNSTISGNTATQYGGGLANNNADVTVTGGAFTNNNASGPVVANGGAINNVGTLTMTSVTVSGNTATINGGGIYNSGDLMMTNVTVSGNSTTVASPFTGGGGIANGSNLIITGSTISNNVAATSGSSGGGLFNGGGNAIITGTTFSGNSASPNSGGAIYTSGINSYLAATIFKAGASGGNCAGISHQTDNGYNLADDATCGFTTLTSWTNAILNLNPLANNEGGTTQTQEPIWHNDALAYIPNGTTITNNIVTLHCNGTDTDQNGIARPRVPGAACTSGAVEPDPVAYTCPSTVLTEIDLGACLLQPKYLPGSISTTLGADITLSGALPTITGTVTIQGAGHFVDGNNRVGVFQVYAPGNLTLNNITIQHGVAEDGAGILNVGGTLAVTNSTITGNAGQYGGGIFTIDASAHTTISNSTISSNTAMVGGGGILISNSTLEVTDSTFAGNSAGDGFNGGGGALEDEGQATVTTSTFENNTSPFGAAIINTRGIAAIDRSTFFNNTASRDGGAIENYAGEMSVSNSTFSANQSGNGAGGAIANWAEISNADAILSLTSNTFYGNTASSGSNLYNTGTINLAGNVFQKAGNDSLFSSGGVENDNGYNIADDGSLPGSGIGSKNNAHVNLGPLQNNGGPTQTQRPGIGDDELGAIPNGVSISNDGVALACNGSTIDQAGSERPLAVGGVCSSGALEAYVTQHLTIESPVGVTIANGGTLDMGTTPLGVPIQKIVTVRNPGLQPLSIWNNPPAVTGGFTVSTLGSTAIAGGGSTTFTLTCPVTTPGNPISGTVSINSDDPGTNPFTFNVSCTVTAPKIALEAPGLTPITNGGIYDMGSTLAGTALVRTITVNNIGTASLTLTNPAPTTPIHAGNFGALTVAPGGSTTFDLTCDATSASPGPLSGVISFTTNDPTDNPFLIKASCQVLSADLLAPSSLAVTPASQTQMNLSWVNNATDATELRIERSLGGGWTQVGTVPATATTFQDSLLDCNTTYYYRIRAYRSSDSAFSNYSNVANNTTLACSLAAPTLVAPANGTQTNNNTPTFTWNVVATADNYQIQIEDTSNFSSPVQTSTTATLSYAATQLTDGTTYYWRVRALRNGNTEAGPWSAPFSVQVDRFRLAAPALVAPTNNVIVGSLLPKFTWGAVTGATQYKLQVDDDPAFGSPLFTRTLGKVTTYTALSSDAFQFGSTYYWRVQAGDAQNVFSNWSAAWTFPITIQKTPTNGAYSISQTPTFAWTAVPGATAYEFQVSSSTSFATIEASSSNTSLTYTISKQNPLIFGQHYWRVRVTTSAGTSPWMGPWTLTVTPSLPKAPVLSSPAANVMTTNKTPGFSWVALTASGGITYNYQIQIATTSNFLGPVQDVVQPDVNYSALTLDDGLYYWRVRAINSVNTTGPWSAMRTFTVDTTPPAAPTLSAPADRSGTTLVRPKFIWLGSTSAKTYTLNIYDFDGVTCGASRLTAPSLTTTSYTIPTSSPALPSPGQYCWNVFATDALGNAGTPGNLFHFTVNPTPIKPPIAPTLTAPATATNWNPSTLPALAWTMGVVTGNQFEVQIDTSATFSHPVQDAITAVDQLNYTVSPSVPAGTYWWRVRAINGQGVAGAYSALRTFTMQTAGPAAPILLTPANNSSTTSQHPVLKWQAVTGAKSYVLDVATDSGFTTLLVNQKPIVAPAVSYTLTTEVLTYGKTYYWRVHAVDAATNAGSPSAVFQFTASVHMAPANGSSTMAVRPVFQWMAVPGATGYLLQVSRNVGFTDLVVNTPTTTLTKLTAPTLAYGTYYWQVTVTAPGGPFVMPVWTVIVTANAPAVPVLLTPANNGLINDGTPTFTWKAAANATHYEMEISNASTFASVLQDITTGTGILQFTADTLADGKYYWRVRSLNVNNAPGAWSAGWIVTIDTLAPPVPVVVGPADGTHTTNPSLTLRWNASAGASRYEIRFGSDNPPQTPPVSVGNVVSYVVTWPHQQGTYYWQVHAIDAAGNASDWTTARSLIIEAGLSSASVKPTPTATPEPASSAQQPIFAPPTNTPSAPTTATPVPTITVEAESSAVIRTGNWTVQDTANASGGKYLYSSSQPGDALTLGFSGTHVDIVFVKHPAFGSFAIEIDGTLRQTANAHDAQSSFGAQVSLDDLTPGTHILRVYAVQGTVAVDAFKVEAAVALPPTVTPTATE